MSTTIYVLSKNMKNIKIVLPENFTFLIVNFSINLNRCVFRNENKYLVTGD